MEKIALGEELAKDKGNLGGRQIVQTRREWD